MTCHLNMRKGDIRDKTMVKKDNFDSVHVPRFSNATLCSLRVEQTSVRRVRSSSASG